jgi:Tfp pilus assembly protein PilZ
VSDEARSLRIDFDSEATFRGEYVSNISNGGVFIETNAGFAVREPVRIDLALGWCDELISLDGEIVRVEPGGAGRAGVAVQFALRVSALHPCSRACSSTTRQWPGAGAASRDVRRCGFPC